MINTITYQIRIFTSIVLLLSLAQVKGQSVTYIYQSATSTKDFVKIIEKEGAVVLIELKKEENKKWNATKIVKADITQEYLELIQLPEGDTLQMVRHLYFDKVVLKNNRGQQTTYWLKK